MEDFEELRRQQELQEDAEDLKWSPQKNKHHKRREQKPHNHHLDPPTKINFNEDLPFK